MPGEKGEEEGRKGRKIFSGKNRNGISFFSSIFFSSTFAINRSFFLSSSSSCCLPDQKGVEKENIKQLAADFFPLLFQEKKGGTSWGWMGGGWEAQKMLRPWEREGEKKKRISLSGQRSEKHQRPNEMSVVEEREGENVRNYSGTPTWERQQGEKLTTVLVPNHQRWHAKWKLSWNIYHIACMFFLLVWRRFVHSVGAY